MLNSILWQVLPNYARQATPAQYQKSCFKENQEIMKADMTRI